jgi:hypothetical protein
MPRLEGMESSIREPSYKECVALWLRPVMPVSKHRCALGNPVVVALAQHRKAPESRGGVRMARWRDSICFTVMGESLISFIPKFSSF